MVLPEALNLLIYVVIIVVVIVLIVWLVDRILLFTSAIPDIAALSPDRGIPFLSLLQQTNIYFST